MGVFLIYQYVELSGTCPITFSSESVIRQVLRLSCRALYMALDLQHLLVNVLPEKSLILSLLQTA